MCSQVFLIFHSQNVWQAWHEWDCPIWQDKAEEDRDERKKPSAHQREWVPLMCMSVCLWTAFNQAMAPFSLQQLSYQSLFITSSAVKKPHVLSCQWHCYKISTSVIHGKSKSAIFYYIHYNTSLLTTSLSFSSLPAIEQERKGDATPWPLSTRRKEAEMPQQKALSFDYHSIQIPRFLQKRVLLSYPGCCKDTWHPHIGSLLPLEWKMLAQVPVLHC